MDGRSGEHAVVSPHRCGGAIQYRNVSFGGPQRNIRAGKHGRDGEGAGKGGRFLWAGQAKRLSHARGGVELADIREQ